MEKFLKILFFIFVVGIVIFSCRKTRFGYNAEAEFNATEAKEWYYEVFKKTNEWKLAFVEGKKLPNWKSGVYKRKGKIEIVEFPIIADKKKILLSKENSQSENIRLAENSLHKVVFISLMELLQLDLLI